MDNLQQCKEKRIPAGTSYPGSGMCCDATVPEKFHELQKENEMLNRSLLSLTTYCAQIQFRLRQIAEAPWTKKEKFIKDLEEFSSRGIPELRSKATNNFLRSSSIFEQGGLKDRILIQREETGDLIIQTGGQFKALNKYTDSTTDGRFQQHSKEKAINGVVNDTDKLNFYTSKSSVPNDINQVTEKLKMEDIFVTQLKQQISDFERHIKLLKENLAFGNGSCEYFDNNNLEVLNMSKRNQIHTSFSTNVTKGKKKEISRWLCLPVLTQSGFDTHISATKINHWGNLRANLEITVLKIVEISRNVSKNSNDVYRFCGKDKPGMLKSKDLTFLVRKKLVPCIQDLAQHGLRKEGRMSLFCIGQRLDRCLHVWQLILQFYAIHQGTQYNNSPARRLSQSFNMNTEVARTVTTEQELLEVIGNITATHSPYKKSFDSHFKAFVCAALNYRRLVVWLRTILTCGHLIQRHYETWSYVAMTAFEDGLQCLDRLTMFKFDLPVNLAVRRFTSINDAF
jgi:hypothetical protein